VLRSIAGRDIWVTQTGEGPPRLFIHCSLAQGRSLRALDAALGPAHSTFFDLPGHGKSGAWVEGDHHGETCAVADGLLNGPAHLIGHSYGGTVALRMAVEAPQKVSRITLIEPVMFVAVKDAAARDAHRRAFAPFVQAMEQGDLARASEVFTAMWGTGPGWQDLPQTARERIASQIHMIPAASPVIEEDNIGLVARLGQISCPVDLIEGSDSQPVMSHILDGLAARIPQARRHVIDGAGHMVALTHPEKVAVTLG